MSKIVRQGFLLLAVLCSVLKPNEAAALGEDCTSATCTVVNSECQDSDKTCVCKANYANPGDGTCTTIIGIDCSSDSTVCSVANSECDGNTNTCDCKENYVNPGDGTCTKILGTACTSENANTVCTVGNSGCTDSVCACQEYYKDKDAACVTILSNDCTTTTNCAGVSHSECKDSTMKCECMSGYMTVSNTHCTEVLEADCSSDATICNSLSNSVCTDGKCACAENYVVSGKVCLKVADQSCTVDSECASGKCEGETGSKTCATENAASSVTVAAGMLVLTFFVTLFPNFF